MTESDHTSHQTKGESTRTHALEKEVARLKTLSKKQSVKYNKLKKTASFQFLFFIVLFIMMFAYGIIQWPITQEVAANGTETTRPVNDTVVADTIILPPIKNAPLTEMPKEDMLFYNVPEDGILFSIQIGAYTEVNMEPFRTNMFSLQQYSYQTINQFTVGIFQEFNDAEAFRDIIQHMGFYDAFIIATLNGKRMPIKEALALKSRQEEEQTVAILNDSLP